MRHRHVRGSVASGLVLLALPLGALAVFGPQERGDGPAGAATPRVPEASRVVEPIAPDLPAEVVAALQQGEYEAACRALADWAERPDATGDERAYAALIRGIALRLDGDRNASREALTTALEAAPEGRWSAKLRFELAATELAADRPEQAEALARAQVEALLDPDRKDDLAGVYLAFADRLLEPDEPTASPDPEAAYALLAQARELAKGADVRARLLFRMGRASQQAGNPGRAIEDFQRYLDEYPEGDDRAAARFHLGEAQLDAGQPLPARLTWTDLARDLEDADGDDDRRTAPKALFKIARPTASRTPATTRA